MFQDSRSPDKPALVDADENAKTCQLFVFGCFCVPLFLIGIILYVIFAFIYLVRNYHVCNDRSILWVHVVIVLAINAVQVAIQYSADQSQDLAVKNIASLLGLNLIIVIYGAVVLFGDGIVCDDMRQSGLWVVAHVMFWVAVITTIFALFLVGMALYGYLTTGKATIERRLQAHKRRNSKRTSMSKLKVGASSDSKADVADMA